MANEYRVWHKIRLPNIKCYIVAILILCNTAAKAQQALLPHKSLIRYEENYDSVRVDTTHVLLDRLKHVSFFEKRAYVSLGAEVRVAYEFYQNPAFGLFLNGTDQFLLERAYLHADLHVKSRLRFFGQLASGLKQGGTGSPLPIQEDQLFLHQAFVEADILRRGSKRVTLRVGRQELQVGSGRILSTRVGPNIRQSFDVARIIVLGMSNWNFTAFYGRPVVNNIGVFDNPTLAANAPQFWNVGATRRWRGSNVDAYYFGYAGNKEVYQQGIGKELRHSIGGRVYAQGRFDYDVEFLYQTGRFQGATISAYTASANVGYNFPLRNTTARVGLKTEYLSGDKDRHSKDLQTFNALFPDGGYFGGVNTLGYANLYDIHPSVDVQVSKNVRLGGSLALFWRAQLDDGLYNPGRFLIVKDDGYNPHRFIGGQVGQTLSWSINRFVSFRFLYGHFFAGPYLTNSNPQRLSVDFATGMLTFLF